MSIAALNESFGPVFDADNHYWEASDAFTRHRDPKFRDRGLTILEEKGRQHYFVNGRKFDYIPGPGDKHPRPIPGSLYDYFAGRSSIDPGSVFVQDPQNHPEYFDRDVRLACMDKQGLEAAWMFPSHAIELEGVMQGDVEASLHILGAFNRWLDEDWGLAYKNRIFSVPLLSFSDLDLALSELDWALKRGVRLIAMRHGPAFTRDGYKSPADRMFDRFWARVEEAGITVAMHGGQEQSYVEVSSAVARAWGVTIDPNERLSPASRLEKRDFSGQFIGMLQKQRLVHDHAAALLVHGLFDRFPRLRMAFVEFGSRWVGPLLHDLEVTHAQNPGMFGKDPVKRFHENIWVAPFVEDDVNDLAKHIPTDRILFGSDWPHAEGVAQPRDFFASLDGFSESDVRKIMSENARALTYG